MTPNLDTSTGWRIDLDNPAELRRTSTGFRYLVDGHFEAPEEIDPRSWMQVENQSSMGSCQGHALSSVCEFVFNIESEEVIQFSRMFGYLGTQKLDGLLGRDRGSTINGGRKLVQEYGICRESVFPYPNPVRYSPQIPEMAWTDAKNYKIKTHSFCRSYDDVFAFLASGQGAVEIGIRWRSSMRGAVIEKFSGGGGGGHAVAFLGYSRRKDSQDRNYLWLVNSWGKGWGKDGWAEVAPGAVDQMARDQYTVMIGLSDMDTPKPRPIKWTENSPW